MRAKDRLQKSRNKKNGVNNPGNRLDVKEDHAFYLVEYRVISLWRLGNGEKGMGRRGEQLITLPSGRS